MVPQHPHSNYNVACDKVTLSQLLIFDIVVKLVNLLFQKATSLNLWNGLEVCKNGFKLFHLQYEDDTILFCPRNIESLLSIKSTLILSQLASRLKVNFHKSSIVRINVEEDWLNMAANKLLCKIGTLPFTYLGLPIGGKTSNISTWDPILERMRKKFASWKGNLLSLGGRAILIKASLSSIPLYYKSLFPMPVGEIEKITRIQRQFLWGDPWPWKLFPLIMWNSVQLPKEFGGLNMGNPLHKNFGLLFKCL